jgi:hypothetical protein
MATTVFPEQTDALINTRLRYMLNDPNALSFTDTELLRWTDRGANILLGTTKGKESYLVETLINGTAEYSFANLVATADSDSIINIETVFYTGTTSITTPQTAQAGWCLQKVHPRQLANSPFSATDTPKWWYEVGSTTENLSIIPAIGIHPTPLTATGIIVLYYESMNTYDNGTLETGYVYPDSAAGTANNLPEHMQDAVTWYVLAKANEKYKRYEVSQMFMSIFMNFAVFYRQDYNPKPVDSMDMMTAPDFTQFA